MELTGTLNDANTFELADAGMACLTEQFGVVGAEAFIALVLREKLDYTNGEKTFMTKWHRESFMKKPLHMQRNIPIQETRKDYNPGYQFLENLNKGQPRISCPLFVFLLVSRPADQPLFIPPDFLRPNILPAKKDKIISRFTEGRLSDQ